MILNNPDIERSKIVILGSTGSVGTQAVDVAEQNGIAVEAISGHKSIGLLENQIRRLSPKYCLVTDEASAVELRTRVSDTGTKILAGAASFAELLSNTESEIAVNAVTGKAGLLPTLEALKTKKRLALANKESLVIAGELVTGIAKEKKVDILPVDSEHSAIYQCIGNHDKREIRRLILTASGGRFFGMTREQTSGITPEQALSHPTWKMGPRITVDSSTMMNKGFEVIEAVWLFGMPIDSVDVVIQRESIIHSMVEYIDRAVIAQLGVPDMRHCIQYAVTCPERKTGVVDGLDFTKLSKLHFDKPDNRNFPCLKIAVEAYRRGGVSTAALNAADEVAVGAFLDGRLPFNGISDVVSEVVSRAERVTSPGVNEYLAADLAARKTAEKIIEGY